MSRGSQRSGASPREGNVQQIRPNVLFQTLPWPRSSFPAPLPPYCTHIGPYDAALGSHEDQADKDGRAQHAHSTHQWVGPLGLQAAPARGSCTRDHTQKARKAGDGPKDETVGTEGHELRGLRLRSSPVQGPSPDPGPPRGAPPVLGSTGRAVARLRCLLHNLGAVQVERDPHAQGPCGEGDSRRGQGGEDVAAAGERPGSDTELRDLLQPP